MLQRFFSGGGPEVPPHHAHQGSPVILHIYDLGNPVVGLNNIARAMGSGAYHAGVEVYGWEWSFGGFTDGPYGSGVFRVPPKTADVYMYREGVHMGMTPLASHEVDMLLDRLAREWHGNTYDLLRHNCCHFSDELCIKLGVGPIPSWVTSLAGAGAMLRSTARIGATGVAEGAAALLKGATKAANLFYGGDGSSTLATDPRLALPPSPYPEAQHSEYPALANKAAHGGGYAVHDTGPLPQGGGGYALHNTGPAMADQPAYGRRNSAPAAEQTRDILKAGDAVEIYSNSCQAWCRGLITEVRTDNMAGVTFEMPDTSETASKFISVFHSNLRRASALAPEAVQRSKSAPSKYQVGDPVEIFSNSQQIWCAGRVESVERGMVAVVFQVPVPGHGQEWSKKTLPCEHTDLRPSMQTRRAISATPHSAEPPPTRLPAEHGGDAAIQVGDWAEVFSNSAKKWCVARVAAIVDGWATVVFQTPGSSKDEWVEKKIRLGHNHLRPLPKGQGTSNPLATAATEVAPGFDKSGVKGQLIEAELTAMGFDAAQAAEAAKRASTVHAAVNWIIESQGTPRSDA
eukprot:TRINITY_DN65035_c0_g1_i1.p1 TRINITY_DN65035_c0_g1~~TRINITY_DN65035_c0_g1_i1.p1  ORF type:complete len:572 (+),score=66.59 TRINITY_DN65035_c0_g1_i1:81-1796(+)